MEHIKKAIKTAMLERKEHDSFLSTNKIDDEWKVGVYKDDNTNDFLLIKGNKTEAKLSYDPNDISDYEELWDDLIEEVADKFSKYITSNNPDNEVQLL